MKNIKPHEEQIVSAFKSALSKSSNYCDDGSVNWKFVNADVYLQCGPFEVRDSNEIDEHCRYYDSVSQQFIKKYQPA